MVSLTRLIGLAQTLDLNRRPACLGLADVVVKCLIKIELDVAAQGSKVALKSLQLRLRSLDHGLDAIHIVMVGRKPSRPLESRFAFFATKAVLEASADADDLRYGKDDSEHDKSSNHLAVGMAYAHPCRDGRNGNDRGNRNSNDGILTGNADTIHRLRIGCCAIVYELVIVQHDLSASEISVPTTLAPFLIAASDEATAVKLVTRSMRQNQHDRANHEHHRQQQRVHICASFARSEERRVGKE